MPEKTLYSLNEKGNAYFNELMEESSKNIGNIYLEFNAFLVNIENLPEEKRREYLKNFKEKAEERRSFVESVHSHAKQTNERSGSEFLILDLYNEFYTILQKWSEKVFDYYRRYIFFINIPIGCICILLTMKFIKESYDPTASKSIDFGGIITISIAMFCLTFALMKANEKGWTSSFILSFFAVSAIALILFVIIELKVKEPMVPLSLFKSIPFTNGSITLFLLGLGMMSGTYLLSFFLIQVKGLNQLSAGLIISTMSLTSMFFSLLAPILTKKLGSRLTSALGILLLCTSCYLNSSLTQNSSNIDIILRLIVAGSGTGLSMATLIGSIMANVPVDKIGIASGINNMTRTLGTVLGVALFLTIFTSNMTTQMSDAKNSAVQTIQNDTVFDNEAKLQMISSVKAGTNKNVSLLEILNAIDKKETAVLASSPAVDENKIKESFEAQKKEIQKIVPNIRDTFLTYTVKSFSFTFKISSVLLLPGILFALFSDKKRTHAIKNKKFVGNINLEKEKA